MSADPPNDTGSSGSSTTTLGDTIRRIAALQAANNKWSPLEEHRIRPESQTDATSPPVVTTQPKQVLRHSISDEQLEMLTETSKDLILEFLWIAIGALVGAAPASIAAIVHYISDSDGYVFSVDELAQLLIFFAAMCVTGAMGVVAYRRGSRVQAMKKEIRDRSNGDHPSV